MKKIREVDSTIEEVSELRKATSDFKLDEDSGQELFAGLRATGQRQAESNNLIEETASREVTSRSAAPLYSARSEEPRASHYNTEVTNRVEQQRSTGGLKQNIDLRNEIIPGQSLGIGKGTQAFHENKEKDYQAISDTGREAPKKKRYAWER